MSGKNDRADRLIASLGLIRHPEGGWYKEVYRADTMVIHPHQRRKRSTATAIYYLLKYPDYSSPLSQSRAEERDRKICPPCCRHNLRRQSSFLWEGGSIAGAPTPVRSIGSEVPKSRKHRDTTQKVSLLMLHSSTKLFHPFKYVSNNRPPGLLGNGASTKYPEIISCFHLCAVFLDLDPVVEKIK